MDETTFTAATPAEWRAWLAENAGTAKEVWLIIQHKGNGVASVRIEEAMEQALCFGWIGGLHRKNDATSSRLRFTPRGPRSSWSRVNRERAARLIADGLMTARGRAMIDLTKEKGRWQVVPDGEEAGDPGAADRQDRRTRGREPPRQSPCPVTQWSSRRATRRAMSSCAGVVPTSAAITRAHTTPGSSGVITPASRCRPTSIRRSRRSTRPSV